MGRFSSSHPPWEPPNVTSTPELKPPQRLRDGLHRDGRGAGSRLPRDAAARVGRAQTDGVKVSRSPVGEPQLLLETDRV